jgi:hypothetical protein
LATGSGAKAFVREAYVDRRDMFDEPVPKLTMFARRTIQVVVVALGSIALASLPARSDGLVSQDVDANITKTVRSAIFGTAPNEVLSVPVDDRTFDFDDPDGMAAVTQAVEAINGDADRCSADAMRLSAAYSSLLQSVEWSKDKLNNEERQRLDSVKSQLFQSDQPTPAYADYLRYKAALDKARADLAAAGPAQNTAALQEAVSRAQSDFEILGNAAKFRPLDADYRNLTLLSSNAGPHLYAVPGDPAALVEATKFLPALTQLASGNGWTSFTFQFPTSGTSNAWAGSQISLSFDALKVSVVRPWFSDDFFRDDSWRYGSAVSNGAGQGLIGRYVSSLAFVRNIKIAVSSVKTAKKALATAARANQVVRLGPFVLSDRTPADLPFLMYLSARSHTFVDGRIQLLGCVQSNTPSSPSPNSEYTW